MKVRVSALGTLQQYVPDEREIEVKNRGSLKMYFVEGMKSSVPA